MLSSFRSAVLLAAAAAPGLAAGPLPLKYTASLGDGANITAVAVDASGSVYVAGSADSALSVTPGAFQTAYQPGTCARGVGTLFPFPCPVAFAGKLSPDGTVLVYLTYLGTSMSVGTGISVDAQGNAWITGWAGGTDLPVTPGALQTVPKSNPNLASSAFVLKLNAAGSRVLYASYFGGSNDAFLNRSQTVDDAGNLYVGGYTQSADFPVTSGAFQTDPGPAPPKTGFVTKFDPTGKLVYSTYFHGLSASTTSIASIAVDASGNAYATGSHTGGSLPVTAGAFQTVASASATTAAFAAKFDPTGSKLLYCTYLAADTPDRGAAIAVDRQGDAYVSGNIVPRTYGLPFSFPVTTGAFQTTPPASPPVQAGYLSTGFIAKLNAAGSGLIYSTYLGASDATSISALAVDSAGSAVVLGNTWALDFPTTAGALFQCSSSGISTAISAIQGFLFKLAADGSQPLYSTYLGTGATGVVLALDSDGEAHIAGSLSGLPVVPGSFGWTGSNGYFASIASVAALALEPLPVGSVSCVVSAASHGGTTGASGKLAIAPGEIVDILGNGIGPAETVYASIVAGQLPSSLGGVEVTFSGWPAPLLSAGPNQIRAIVPFEIGPIMSNVSQLVDVQIFSSRAAVQQFTVTLASLVPSVYTLDGKPEGQALMVNQDGTPNSAQNPATQGSTVTIYATGLNNTDPALATGSVATAPAPLAFSLQLTVWIPGRGGNGKVTYAGAAPGLAAGVTQINFQIPYGAAVGLVPVQLQYPTFPDFAESQLGVYFYVK